MSYRGTKDNESTKIKGEKEDDTVPTATECKCNEKENNLSLEKICCRPTSCDDAYHRLKLKHSGKGDAGRDVLNAKSASVQERGTQYDLASLDLGRDGVIEKPLMLPGPSVLNEKPQDEHDEGQGATGSCSTLATCNPENSSRNSFWCWAVLFRSFKNQSRTRLAWYISDDRAIFDQSNLISYEEDTQECILDGRTTFCFQDYLCVSLVVESDNEAFSLCANEKPERPFTREYICQNSLQKYLLPIVWHVERNDSARGIGGFKATFRFKTSRSDVEFIRDILTHRAYGPQVLGEVPFEKPMPTEDRSAIRVCFPGLIKEIYNIKELAMRLFQYGILTKDETKEFSRIGRKKKKIILLLLTVQRRGNVWGFLKSALQYTEKEENAARMLREARESIKSGRTKKEDPFPMSDADRQKVIRCFMDLIHHIRNKKDVLAELYSRWILDEDKIEEIMSMKTRSDKVDAILKVVMSSGRKLSDFIDILGCTGNGTAIRKLKETKRSGF